MFATVGKKYNDTHKFSQTEPKRPSQSSNLPTKSIIKVKIAGKSKNKVQQYSLPNMKSKALQKSRVSFQDVSNPKYSSSEGNYLGVPNSSSKQNKCNQQSSFSSSFSEISENQVIQNSFKGRTSRRRGASVVYVSRRRLKKLQNKSSSLTKTKLNVSKSSEKQSKKLTEKHQPLREALVKNAEKLLSDPLEIKQKKSMLPILRKRVSGVTKKERSKQVGN